MCAVRYYGHGELISKLSPDPADYRFAGAGGYGCVFIGPFDGNANCVIKYDAPMDVAKDGREFNELSAHEGIMGNFFTFPGAREVWVQTIAFGEYTGAVKVLRKAAKQNGSEKAIRCAAHLKDPKNTHVFVVQQSAGEMEMTEWIRNKTLPNRQIRQIAFQLVWAMYVVGSEYGVVHGDLKPQNIMVTPADKPTTLHFGIRPKTKTGSMETFSVPFEKGDPLIRIIDIGGTYLNLGEKTAQERSPFFETLTYTDVFASPEFLETETFSAASDLYAIGVIMCVLCCHNTGFAVQSKRYDYNTFNQAPVPGKTVQGHDIAFVDAINAASKDKQFTAHRALAQALLLSFAVGSYDVPPTELNTLPKKMLNKMKELGKTKGVDLLGMMPDYVQGEKEKDFDRLLFVRDLLLVNPEDRLAFSIPGDKHGAANALYHSYFASYYTPNIGVQEGMIIYEGGYKIPLSFGPKERMERVRQFARQILDGYKLDAQLDRRRQKPVLPSMRVQDKNVATELERILTALKQGFVIDAEVRYDVLINFVNIMHDFAHLIANNGIIQAALLKEYPPSKDSIGWIPGKMGLCERPFSLVQETVQRLSHQTIPSLPRGPTSLSRLRVEEVAVALGVMMSILQ
jgi:serine/threonine protein kinase